MTIKTLLHVAALAAFAALSTGCANTIRGVGQDTAAAVDATQQAGENVGQSAAY